MRRPAFAARGAQHRGQVAHGLGGVQHFVLAQRVDLLGQQFDLKLGLDVDVVVALGGDPLYVRLSVLARQGEGRGAGGLSGAPMGGAQEEACAKAGIAKVADQLR